MILCCFFFGCQVRQINKKYVLVTFQFQGLEKKIIFLVAKVVAFSHPACTEVV